MRSDTIIKARAIERRYGTNYYLATLFLPREEREAVFILYAFVRIPDELVDNPVPGSDPVQLLRQWRTDWCRLYETGEGGNDIMQAARIVFVRYQIPFSLSLEFIDAMLQDLTQSRYATYVELQAYMRGSAEVIGIMLTHVLGYSDRVAFGHAERLGEAMQFTNFLRDIAEDYFDRDRIYIPQEDMARFSVRETMIEAGAVTPEIKSLMQFEIERNRALYRQAEPGIELLTPSTQRAVRLAARFYEAILDEIERHNYDIFIRQARPSSVRKFTMLISSYVKR